MDITQILKEYSLEPALKTKKFNSGGVNTDFAFYIEKDNEKYLLKSIRKDHVSQVARACKLTDLLRKHNFDKTTKNIKRVNGEYILTDKNDRDWELQVFIKGKHVEAENLTTQNIKSLTSTLSDLHNTFIAKNKPAELELHEEIPYINMFNAEQHERMVEAVDTLKKARLPTKDKQLLLDYWKKYQEVRLHLLKSLHIQYENLHKSIIHRDLNKGNILFSTDSNDVKAFVDWDTVMWGNVIQDVCYLSSHYLLLENSDSLNAKVSKKLIQTFVDEYQRHIRFTSLEKEIFVDLVDVLRVRATRWWSKRYLELYKASREDTKYSKKFESHRGGFQKTLTKWMNNRDKILKIFHSINL
jgi:Ser/Thr protein kinase RdoA (MazF antagonist)